LGGLAVVLCLPSTESIARHYFCFSLASSLRSSLV
jgi:hypothetical protein